MKHKTENTHKKHIIKQQSDSSGVTAWLSRADWSSPVQGPSMYVIPTHTTSLALGVRTQEVISGGIINMTTGLTVTLGFQCMYLIGYFCSDLTDKVVKLHLDVHMHLAQGEIYTFYIFFPHFKLFFGMFDKSCYLL